MVLYDATLREGTQSNGLWMTVRDRIRTAQLLDELGIQYIEGGNPGAGAKEQMFFQEAKHMVLHHAKLVAFGSTVRRGARPQDDPAMEALLGAGTGTVCVFGKAWDLHATKVLGISLTENLGLIADSVAYLKGQGREVIFDSEHFFDGYKNNPDYAMATLYAAVSSRADWVCLCDTNGGCMPWEIEKIVCDVRKKIGVPLGIHCHDDTGMADANSLMAVRRGVTMVQSTLNGYGERCGNANTLVQIANLTLKMEKRVVAAENIAHLATFYGRFNGITNVNGDPMTPYVGQDAFFHKAGMHVDGILKDSHSFEHIDPALVGAKRRMAVGELSGKKAVRERIKSHEPDMEWEDAQVEEVLRRIKALESKGYQFEGADASLELLIQKTMGLYVPHFRLIAFKTFVEEPHVDDKIALATIEIQVGEEVEITAAWGNGPVDALDAAARKALLRFYPTLSQMHLTDYRVRVLDGENATGAEVRVVIESRDANDVWSTVGVSTDIINASWIAIMDSLEYKMMKDGRRAKESNKGSV